MSVNIVLPTLTQWTKNHVTAIIQAKNQAALEAAVDAFLSKSATINVNGAQITRDAFVQQLSSENFDEQGATVNFNESVEVRADPTDGFSAGSVGLFYTAVIVEAIRVLGAPVSSQVTASLNVVIAEDPAIPPPHLPGGIHGFFDGRRVMALNEIRTQARVDAATATA
ncbi:hypothetical protein D9619_009154 [Psilocybe cf. subviscida]|uniref:Uncharacterized protein n=1 Tax=Psilocybe cf. subviscida TaxID=2480587 RepID=A0A8H5FAP6_9AGAR|nr:hypothetical protein D9619_009154 [Psilocybe cf. subviscida]